MIENQLSSNMSIQEDVLKLRVENEELKTQNQKMRCCGNCKHSSYSALFHEVVCIKALCRNFDKWELAE